MRVRAAPNGFAVTSNAAACLARAPCMATEQDRAPPSTEVSPQRHLSDGSVQAQAAASGERFAIGECLSGRYRIERELGEGGMGVVYLAIDKQVAGEVFAVKVLKEGLVPEALSLQREEVRKTRKLKPSQYRGCAFGERGWQPALRAHGRISRCRNRYSGPRLRWILATRRRYADLALAQFWLTMARRSDRTLQQLGQHHAGVHVLAHIIESWTTVSGSSWCAWRVRATLPALFVGFAADCDAPGTAAALMSN
jgi:hypothetical protein